MISRFIHRIMESWYAPASILLVIMLSPHFLSAQCLPPTAASIISMPAACQGQGQVIITVTNPLAGAVYQYQLQYDSTGNTSVVKPWQSSDTFSQVSVGRYKAYIRQVCNSSFSTEFVSSSITVNSSTTPLSINQIRALSRSSCSNGSLDVTVTGGNTEAPYQYALIPSLNELEPVANYVRPQQNGNSFSGLPAGTYYARVYDDCGTYSTASVTIDTVTESVQLNAPRSGYAFYGCDSLNFSFTVTINNRLPSVPNGSPVAAEDRFWVTYNGITDTLSNNNIFFGFYNASNGTSYTTRFDMLRNITYPATVMYGFRSACGNVYQQIVTIIKPKLNIGIQSSNAVSCTQRRYFISALDSVGNNSPNYAATSLSKDSGQTWGPLNSTSYLYIDTFIIGNTYNVWLASGCDTARSTVTIAAPALAVTLNSFTAYSCNNNSGFYISIYSYTGNPDSILLKVLNQPAEANLPDSFYYYQNSYQLTYDLPPGTYTLSAQDQCGLQDTTTITIDPTVVDYTIAPLFSCQPSQSGFRLNVTETNYQPYGGYSYLRAIVTNTATNQTDSFQSADYLSRPTTIDVTGLSNGTYSIRVIKVRPSIGASALPYFNCGINSTYTNTANQPLSLNQSMFTSACTNGTATIVATVQGGGGSNQFYLDQQSGGSSWSQILGPQNSNVFNNLQTNNVYRIRVTDACGNGTQYFTSFSNAAPSMEYSTTTSPCPGDTFTMGVDADPSATYAWQKNSNPIPGVTGPTYTIAPVPPVGSPVDTYRVKISYGTCDVFSRSYAVNPTTCGQPLPIMLVNFNGLMNERGEAELSWEVANDEFIRSFDIEYSTDGKRFEKAGSLWSNHTQHYQYIDGPHRSPSVYYRLKMYSIDGEANYSGIISLNGEHSLENNLQVYPTIVTDKLYLRHNSETEEILTWVITGMQGNKLRSGSFTMKGPSISVISDLSNLPTSSFILSIYNNQTLRHRMKFVVQQ